MPIDDPLIKSIMNVSYEHIMDVYEQMEQGLTKAEKRIIRRDLCLADLYYLLVVECGRADLQHPWIYERCREVQRKPWGVLDLWAREHGKSSLLTFGVTIWEILRDPECTIAIFSHNKAQARSFVKVVKEEFENNIELKYLFPDVLYARPKQHAQKWTDDEIIVKRKGNPKESTLTACGLLDGMPTGMHFSHRRYDDIVTEKVVTNPEMIQKATQQWELSDNLGQVGGKVGYVGTRYHLFDTYRVMMDRGVVETRIYPATSDGTDDCSKAVLMPPEVLAEKRKTQGIYTFSTQMLLNPLADSLQGFREEWLRKWYPQRWDNMTRVILCDPSLGRSAKSDYTAMWVLGLSGDGNVYVIDMLRARMNQPARKRQLFRWHRQYRPHTVLYERVGFQTDVEHFVHCMEEENYRFDIKELTPVGSKDSRIISLVSWFESGRIYIPHSCVKHIKEGEVTHAVDMVRVFKEEEYLAYPVLSHRDMLDALSQINSTEFGEIPWPSPEESMQQIRQQLVEIANSPVC
jgi:predicted phage terminase large subunit-like protein